MSIVRLNQQLKRLEVTGFETGNEIVFSYFDKVPATERDATFLRALYIGVLAMMEDRLSAFLAKTSNELGTELESLKKIFDMKQELFYKSAVKGILAEEDIAAYLNNLFAEQQLKDTADLTGNLAGKLSKNKTGDIVCRVNGEDELRIAIECKFDKSIRMGEIAGRDVFARQTDTVWSQLIEAQANRGAKASIIVLDYSLVDRSVLQSVHNVKYINDIGFIAIIDSQKGDFSNLSIAYMLARDIALRAPTPEVDRDLLYVLVNRLVKDITTVTNIKKLIHSNIDNNKKILTELEKSMLLFEFNEKYFSKFLQQGTLSREDLLSFYNGDEVRDKFKLIESEIINH